MSIKLLIGPMFSGKSTEQVRSLQSSDRVKVAYINSTDDTRTAATLSVRGNIVTEKNFPNALFIKTTKLMDAKLQVVPYKVILIDEAQFFPDLLEFVLFCRDAGKRVVVAGLNGTFAAVPFGQIHELMPHANEIRVIPAVCSCGEDAVYSRKKTDDKTVKQIGDELYEPICYQCKKLI